MHGLTLVANRLCILLKLKQAANLEMDFKQPGACAPGYSNGRINIGAKNVEKHAGVPHSHLDKADPICWRSKTL